MGIENNQNQDGNQPNNEGKSSSYLSDDIFTSEENFNKFLADDSQDPFASDDSSINWDKSQDDFIDLSVTDTDRLSANKKEDDSDTSKKSDESDTKLDKSNSDDATTDTKSKEGEEVDISLSMSIDDAATTEDENSTPDSETGQVDTKLPEASQEMLTLAKVTEGSEGWVKDTFADIMADESLTDDDKTSILSLPQSKWNSARGWNKDSQLWGKFRNPEYPINEFISHLDKQSPERSMSLKVELMESVITDQDVLNQFAQDHPQSYANFVYGVTTTYPDAIKPLLEAKGLKIVPITSEPEKEFTALLEELKEDDSWNFISGTKAEEAIMKLTEKVQLLSQKEVESRKALEKSQENGKKAVSEEEESGAIPEETVNTYTAIIEMWGKDFDEALTRSGITMPTEEEIRTNPEAALVQKSAYNIAKFGSGELPSWSMGAMKYNIDKFPEFKQMDRQLSEALSRSDYESAKVIASQMRPYISDYGKKRARIPMITSSINLSKKLRATTVTAKPKPQNQQNNLTNPLNTPVIENGKTSENSKSGYVSDSLNYDEYLS